MTNFYKDTICRDSRFETMHQVNDMGLLEPTFRAKVEGIIADAMAKGVELLVLETYRSKARQLVLFNKGATQIPKVGVHHFGLACDLGILKAGGSINWKADYGILGKLAVVRRAIWGGDWGLPKQPHNFRDYDHVQGISVRRQTMLFNGTWYPSGNYDPITELASV